MKQTILFSIFIIFFALPTVVRSQTVPEEDVPVSIADSIHARYDYAAKGEPKRYTFLEFGATYCLPCRQMEDVMQEIRERYSEKVTVEFFNVSLVENAPWAEHFEVDLIPTQIVLDEKGRTVFRHTGVISAESLMQAMVLCGLDDKEE